MFVIVPVLIVIVVVVMIVMTVARYRAAKGAGLDPMAADIQLASRLNNSALLAPSSSQTVAERLSALEDLRRTGAISESEYDAQRRRILGTI